MRVAGIPINDPHVEACVGVNHAAGTIELRFDFQDATNKGLRAKVSVEIEPAEAVDLIDKIIGGLGALNVTISPRLPS
jgi:hypothetical protein